MLGLNAPSRKRSKDEGEKPFWISFSDLMTALMVLFLVAMAVALMAVTQGLTRIEAAKKDREETIASCMVDVKVIADKPEFVGVKVKGYSIEFGTLAEFDKMRHDLTEEKEHFLRKFIPLVLDVARHPSCDKWLKRIVVEGFASQEGSYLYNLNLSYLRSQRILCVLLNPNAPDKPSRPDRELIRTLFLAGGSSFNSMKTNPEESRRVELRLEFRDLGKDKEIPPTIPWDEDPRCPS